MQQFTQIFSLHFGGFCLLNSIEDHAHNRIIIKFGGASLADSNRILKATKFVVDKVTEGNQVVVVVSAIGKTTDTLLNILEKSSNNSIEKKDTDDILSMGERTSIRIFAAVLKSKGLNVKYFDPIDKEWPIITDGNFTNANPIIEKSDKKIREYIQPLLRKNIVPVIAGFIGKTAKGKITTVGRGGSDTTAFILAKSLKTKEVMMVTDSDGIMSADPKIFPDAKRIPSIDINFLVKLADSGAKFIHTKALRYKSPETNVRIMHFAKTDHASEGTILTGGIESELKVNFMVDSSVMSVTVVGHKISEKSDIIYKLIENVKILSKLVGMSLNFDSAIFYISENKNQEKLLRSIHETIKNHEETIAMNVRNKLGFLKISGVGLEETPGVVGRVSECLRLKGINIFGILTITSSILVFVSWGEAKKAKGLIEKKLRGAI